MSKVSTAPVYKVLAEKFTSLIAFEKSRSFCKTPEELAKFDTKHKAAISEIQNKIKEIIKEKFPSGFGFDTGTEFDWEKSKSEKLVFKTNFHHMNEHGYYDGWTKHEIIVTPSFFFGFDIRVTGINRNQIKDYIADVFNQILSEEIPRW